MAERWHQERFGDYLITGRLAVGGMAEIFTAKRVGAGPRESVVVKRILPHLAEDQKFIHMFVDEAKIVSLLEHPNIVQVYDFGSVEGRYYIAMEHVRGLDCARLLRRAKRRRLKVPLGLAIFVMERVLCGLEYAHHHRDGSGEPLRIIHRDISPSNIFVSFEGEVKLGDFGIAFAAERLSRTGAGALKGKLGYLSPEQVAGREIDHRSDLFPAAAVLVELLTGEQLFTGSNELSTLLKIRDVRLESFAPDPDLVPPDVWSVVWRALAKQPQDRYQTAGEFRMGLLAVLRQRSLEPTAAALADFVGSALGIHAETDLTPAPLTMPTANAKGGLLAMPTGADLRLGTTPVIPQDVYEVRDPAGDKVGEFMLAALIERIVSGLIGADFRVRTEPGIWKNVAEVDFLRRHLSDPDMLDQELTPVPDFHGELAKVSTLRVLYRFAIAEESGLLIFESSSVRKEVYLVEGRPEFVASNDPRELLGEFLVSQGSISRETLDAALGLLPAHEGRLGATLVHMRAVSPVKLFKLLVQQVKAKLIDLFTWRRGMYRYYRGRQCPREMFPLGIDGFEVLSHGVRQGLQMHELEAYVKPYLALPLRSANDSPFPIDRFRLHETEKRVLASLASAPTSIGAVLSRFPAGMEERASALHALYLGLECELLKLG